MVGTWIKFTKKWHQQILGELLARNPPLISSLYPYHWPPSIKAQLPCATALPATDPPPSPPQRHGLLLVGPFCSHPAESPCRCMYCHSHHEPLSCDRKDMPMRNNSPYIFAANKYYFPLFHCSEVLIRIQSHCLVAFPFAIKTIWFSWPSASSTTYILWPCSISWWTTVYSDLLLHNIFFKAKA